MPEQITPLSILYLLLHGAGIAVGTVLCFYLLLCRGRSSSAGLLPKGRKNSQFIFRGVLCSDLHNHPVIDVSITFLHICLQICKEITNFASEYGQESDNQTRPP